MKLHQSIYSYLDDVKTPLANLTGEEYGRLQVLSTMRPAIMRHTAELRRMTQFAIASAVEVKSDLPPLAEVREKLRAAQPQSLPVRRPRRDPVQTQIARDQNLAKLLSSEQQCELKPRSRVVDNSHAAVHVIYNRICSEKPEINAWKAWEQARIEYALQEGRGARRSRSRSDAGVSRTTSKRAKT